MFGVSPGTMAKLFFIRPFFLLFRIITVFSQLVLGHLNALPYFVLKFKSIESPCGCI